MTRDTSNNKYDLRHSQAKIGKPNHVVGYMPTDAMQQGIDVIMLWYVAGR